MPVVSPPLTPAQVAALAIIDANGGVPQPATAAPPATALDGNKGSTPFAFAMADHTHAARVQRTTMLTDGSGVAKWIFARPILCAVGSVPPVTYMVEDTGTPVVVQITAREFTTAGSVDTHTSVTVKAQRSRALPATLVSLATLISFDVFGLPAATKVNLFAADPTQ